MGLAQQLHEAVSGPTWKRNPDGSFTGIGFRANRHGPVELKKKTVGKRGATRWFLIAKGQEFDLGRKASFDIAERKLSQLG